MKTIKLTITGNLDVCEFCSQKNFDLYDDPETAFFCECLSVIGWRSIKGIYVNDNKEDNLVKKKGKYIKVVDYFHKLFSENGHSLPIELHVSLEEDCSIDYIIQLGDNEEFDIKKVQLVKSDYEIEAFPYFIVAENILYDGKEVAVSNTTEDYSVDNYYDSYLVNGYING